MSLRDAQADQWAGVRDRADGGGSRRWLLVAAAVAWAGCFLYLGLASNVPSAGFADGNDLSAWGHALATMVLAALLYLILESWSAQPSWRHGLVAVVVATLFGVAIEGLQSLTVDRDPSVADALLDAVGAVAAVTVLSLVRLPLRVTTRYATWGTAVLVVGVIIASAFFTPPERDQTECSTTEVAEPERANSSHAAASGRGGQGPVASYDFGAGRGRVVADTSGVAPALDLRLVGPGVDWLEGRGLRFSGGAARSDGPATKIVDSAERTGEATVEAWVRSDDLSQEGPTRIVTVSDGIDREQVDVHLGQQEEELSVRLRATCGLFNWWTVADVFTTVGTPTHVATTFADHVQRTYVNGELADAERLDGRLGGWDPDYPLVVGNEATMDRAFIGDVLFVAVYDRALTAAELGGHATDDPSAPG